MYILDQLKGIDSTLIEVGRFQKTGIEHPLPAKGTWLCL